MNVKHIFLKAIEQRRIQRWLPAYFQLMRVASSCTLDGRSSLLVPYNPTVLIVGAAKSGKTTIAKQVHEFWPSATCLELRAGAISIADLRDADIVIYITKRVGPRGNTARFEKNRWIRASDAEFHFQGSSPA